MLWYSLITTSHLICYYVVTKKELLCVMLCGSMSHFHIQQVHASSHIACMYKAKIITVHQVAWLHVILNTWHGEHLVQSCNCISINPFKWTNLSFGLKELTCHNSMILASFNFPLCISSHYISISQPFCPIWYFHTGHMWQLKWNLIMLNNVNRS